MFPSDIQKELSFEINAKRRALSLFFEIQSNGEYKFKYFERSAVNNTKIMTYKNI